MAERNKVALCILFYGEMSEGYTSNQSWSRVSLFHHGFSTGTSTAGEAVEDKLKSLFILAVHVNESGSRHGQSQQWIPPPLPPKP